jgi:poly(3-hydroxybutyrate) depolymerase
MRNTIRAASKWLASRSKDGMGAGRLLVTVGALGLLAGACAGDSPGTPTGTGGGAGSGAAGTSGGAGTVGSGGAVGSAGAIGTAGTTGAAGSASTAGQSGTAGTTGAAGTGAGGAAGATGAGGGGGSGNEAGRGGRGGRGGAVGTAGMSGSGGGGGTGVGGGPGGAPGAPVKSPGCGNPPALTSGAKTIQVGGQSRQYTIRIPANYDNNKAYRLIFGMHWIGANAQAVDQGSNLLHPFFGLQRLDTQSSAIFVAPTALDGRWTSQADLPFVDAMVKTITDGLCIDTSRVFSTGFSYGAMFSYTLGCDRPKVFRAVAPIAGAYQIGCANGKEPVAYLGITGMQDATCTPAMGRQCRDTFVAANGCTKPASVPDWTSANGQAHVCYSYEGCMPGYPVRWCTGNFQHIAAHCDQCSPGQDDRERTWFPGEIWNFFTQF